MAKNTKELDTLIIDFVKNHPNSSSKEIHQGINQIVGYATVKRSIQGLINENLLIAKGKSRGTKYAISPAYELLIPIDTDTYFEKEIDERVIKTDFSYSLISNQLSDISLFSNEELELLNQLQQKFEQNIKSLTKEEFKKEFERLAIDLSWKSSQIEGNTYSLLETERLLKDKETASGKTKDEAVMLLNHKDALDFILENTDYVQPLTVARIEDIHTLLTKELNISRNIRQRRVGISGTNYKPIDNEYQIKEAMGSMCSLVNEKSNVFEKALLVLLLISYIQPFTDGNKRTARIISNAILMSYKYCPLSFRTVESIDYKKAMLIFYEQNNISAFKKIFISQYQFAVETYF